MAALSHPASQGSETLGFAEGGEDESMWSRLVLTAGRFPGGTCPCGTGSPLKGPMHVGLRSASGLSGDSAPHEEDAEHPQVAQGPAGLQVTLQGGIFLGFSPWLCPRADSLSLGEHVAFSSSDFDISFLASFTFFHLLPAGWSLWADNLVVLAAGIQDSASVQRSASPSVDGGEGLSLGLSKPELLQCRVMTSLLHPKEKHSTWHVP
ncbi:unnamed protein product [Rangifer tarandus platyrhynchus]|uniref:Uncharacterized protein n=1 Tax=Rangifer tarandus platyrhynchus TaxID=3082113 RepID=A0AC60A5H9_RANTA